MTVTLTIPIECGEDTCMGESRYCRFFVPKNLSFKPRCRLFDQPLRIVKKNDNEEDLAKRCKQCKEAEKSIDVVKLACELMKNHSKPAYERLERRRKLQGKEVEK